MLTHQPLVVDLEMSDTEYLDLLSQGRDPVREQSHTKELIAYGFTFAEAKEIAPLFDKTKCSIAEQILINQALKQVWEILTRS